MSEPADQRKFGRIESSLTCSVATATDAFEGEIVNLSKGGAAILGPPNAGAPGETLTLMIDSGEVSLGLTAQLMRCEPHGERVLYGVAFDALPPDEAGRLSELLRLTSQGSGQGRREHARVAARVDVNCRSEETFRARLNDLSKGGLSVRCSHAVPVGSTMTVAFGVQGHKGLVEVSGEVMSCTGEGGGGQFRVGVRFTPLSAETREQVSRKIDELLGLPLVDAVTVDG